MSFRDELKLDQIEAMKTRKKNKNENDRRNK